MLNALALIQATVEPQAYTQVSHVIRALNTALSKTYATALTTNNVAPGRQLVIGSLYVFLKASEGTHCDYVTITVSNQVDGLRVSVSSSFAQVWSQGHPVGFNHHVLLEAHGTPDIKAITQVVARALAARVVGTVEPGLQRPTQKAVKALKSFVPGFREVAAPIGAATRYACDLPLVVQFMDSQMRDDGLTGKFGGDYVALAYVPAPGAARPVCYFGHQEFPAFVAAMRTVVETLVELPAARLRSRNGIHAPELANRDALHACYYALRAHVDANGSVGHGNLRDLVNKVGDQ